MKYDIYLFDLDGTIANSYQGVSGGVKYAAAEFGFAIPEEPVLRSFIGPPLCDSFMRVFHVDAATAKEMTETYRVYYRKTGVFEFEVYDGLREVLIALNQAGKTCYVVTSKPTEMSNTIIDHSGLRPYFKEVIGATFDGTLSYKKDIIRHALKHYPIPVSSAVMIGDTAHDILGATENGLDSIAVTYGFGTPEEIRTASPTYTVDTPLQILSI